MFGYLLDDRRIFYAGNDLDWAFALLADLDIDVEHPLQPLHVSRQLLYPDFESGNRKHEGNISYMYGDRVLVRYGVLRRE